MFVMNEYSVPVAASRYFTRRKSLPQKTPMSSSEITPAFLGSAASKAHTPVVIAADQARDFLDSPETAMKIISENQVVLKRALVQGEKQVSFIDLLANDAPQASDHDEQ